MAMPRADFEIPRLIAAAQAHRVATGHFPTKTSGAIPGMACETWSVVDRCLREGSRGLRPGGSSLARFLQEHCGHRNIHDLARLTEDAIAAWAREWQGQRGSLPTAGSGEIPHTGGETWKGIDDALKNGRPDLPGGSSLARLLAERFGYRNRKDLPPLTEELILSWLDAAHRRTGVWPTRDSGPVEDAPGETWRAIDVALRLGRRKLPGGSSLAKLLEERRGVQPPGRRPDFALGEVLGWLDAARQRDGAWPTLHAGPIPEAPGETWQDVDRALRRGRRGLPGGLSLARLLEEHRGVRNPAVPPRLVLPDVLSWARSYRRREGKLPTADSGPIPEAPGETWAAVDAALRAGGRGLRGGSSLSQFLERRLGGRRRRTPERLTYRGIVSWAVARKERTGELPTTRSGPIPEAPGWTWRAVDAALRAGWAELPGGTSLARLLARKLGVRNRAAPPPLDPDEVARWAAEHKAQTGALPTSRSGPVAAAPGETWLAVDWALRNGKRNLPGGSSLARFLTERLGASNRTSRGKLDPGEVADWARAHKARTGGRPTKNSGSVVEAPGETWSGIDACLREGHRELPGGSSLARFLDALGL
jgi:hypothetical protein